jgi:hypothetical protein
MTIYHKHHIIPKHMGGTDDPSNLIELTVEEHAEAHKNLYEKYNKPEDYAAWQGLSGMMDKQQIISYMQSEASKRKNKREVENGTHPFLGDNNPSRKKVKLGTHHFQQNIGNRPADFAQRSLVASGLHHWQSEEHAKVVGKRSKKLIKEQKHPFGQSIQCPHCGKLGQRSAMKRWHFLNCSSASS